MCQRPELQPQPWPSVSSGEEWLEWYIPCSPQTVPEHRGERACGRALCRWQSSAEASGASLCSLWRGHRSEPQLQGGKLAFPSLRPSSPSALSRWGFQILLVSKETSWTPLQPLWWKRNLPWPFCPISLPTAIDSGCCLSHKILSWHLSNRLKVKILKSTILRLTLGNISFLVPTEQNKKRHLHSEKR